MKLNTLKTSPHVYSKSDVTQTSSVYFPFINYKMLFEEQYFVRTSKRNVIKMHNASQKTCYRTLKGMTDNLINHRLIGLP